jgi:predicted Rossmann fold flavoprotein
MHAEDTRPAENPMHAEDTWPVENPMHAGDIWPVVVVGAGAAGLLAALFAARRGQRVLLLETRPRPGAKIRVSGGGRCNVLPAAMALDDYHTSGSRHVLRNILLSWPLSEVRAFFEDDLGIPLKAEPTGKLFPVSERPLDVVAALLAACARAGVLLIGSTRIVRIETNAAPLAPRFTLHSDGGARYGAERVVLATGGLSLPKSGSDGGGLNMAQALGVATVPTYPALVPLLSSDARWPPLAGVSLPVRLMARRGGRHLESREREFLFTHRGFSGPVVLDMSRYVASPEGGDVDLVARWGGAAAPDWEVALRPSGNRQVATILRQVFPARLADVFLDVAGVARDRRESDLGRDERRRLVAVLEHYVLPVCGNEGYATAEVTGGGIALEAVHTRTLETRAVPGLFVCGEMLDVTGRIGGFNFLWAWVTGRRAGEAAAQ